MAEIGSDSGKSLAGTYETPRGVQLGDLLTREVHLTEEMGSRVHSERLQTFQIAIREAGILQSVDFNENTSTTPFPDCVNRVLDVVVFTDGAAGTVARVAVYVRDASTGREVPIYAWDLTVGLEVTARWSDDGAAVADVIIMPNLLGSAPNILARMGVAGLLPELNMRGTTAAFGAGTPDIVALVTLARPEASVATPGRSSHGLPIPGW